jgi:trehalose-phosphatase
MEILRRDFSFREFFRALSESGRGVLVSDYDGTLAPFRVRREDAVPFPGVERRLQRLAASEKTRFVIVSGRGVDDLRRLVPHSGDFEIWGCHGAERRLVDGSHHVAELADKVHRGLAAVDAWAAANDLENCLERKPLSRAFHWRGLELSRIEQLRRLLADGWSQRAETFRLELHEFDGGLELRPSHLTKGNAAAAILKEVGGDTPLAYLGDDMTDEDAFRQIGNRGLKVLVRPEKRSTAADIWIVPPEELIWFLDSCLAALG